MFSRYKFIDILRGLAILFMILNHTARWWLDKNLSYFGNQIIYSTVTLAAPLFLFLVGFCLSISYQKNLKIKTSSQIAVKYLGRGLGIIIIGYIFSLVVFGVENMWGSKVLQAIGASIILSLPILYLLQYQKALKFIIGLAIILPVSFWIVFQPFSNWLTSQYWIGVIFFREFPLWPYFSLVILGIILGKYFVEYGNDLEKLRTYFISIFNWGFGLSVTAFILGFGRSIIFNTPFINFNNDYILNNCWTPGIITSIWIVGAIFVLLSFAYFLADLPAQAGKLGRTSIWLEKLGQTALFIYVLHHLIILNLFSNFLNFRLDNIFLYFVDVLILVVFLVYCAKMWMWGKGKMKIIN